VAVERVVEAMKVRGWAISGHDIREKGDCRRPPFFLASPFLGSDKISLTFQGIFLMFSLGKSKFLFSEKNELVRIFSSMTLWHIGGVRFVEEKWYVHRRTGQGQRSV